MIYNDPSLRHADNYCTPGGREFMSIELKEFIAPLDLSTALPAACIGLMLAPSDDVENILALLAGEPEFAAFTHVWSPDQSAGRALPPLEDAVAYLSADKLYKAALAVGAARIGDHARSEPLEAARIRYASIYCGLVCYHLARQLAHPQPEQILVAGMLHAIGQALLLEHDPERARDIARRANADVFLRPRVEQMVLGFTYADLGGAILAESELPQAIADAVSFHLEPGKAPDSRREAALLHLAYVTLACSEKTSETGAMAAMTRKLAAPAAWDALGMEEALLVTVIDSVDEDLMDVFIGLAPHGAALY